MSQILESELALNVLDEMPICVLLLEDGMIKWANRALAQTLQVAKDELIGLSCEDEQGSAYAALFEDSDQLCLTQSNEEKLWLSRQSFELAGLFVVGAYIY